MASGSRLSRLARRGVATLVLMALVPFSTLATTGCFGSFNLTRKVYDFNRTVSPDKWLRWLIFLAMNFIPIYGFAMIIDAVFANSVEFWGGRNPINADAGTTRVVRGPDGGSVVATWVTPERLRVEVTEPDGDSRVLLLSRSGDGAEARDASGHLLARFGDDLGAPALAATP